VIKGGERSGRRNQYDFYLVLLDKTLSKM